MSSHSLVCGTRRWVQQSPEIHQIGRGVVCGQDDEFPFGCLIEGQEYIWLHETRAQESI